MIPDAPAATPELQRLRNKAKLEIGEIDDLILKRIAEVRQILEGTRTNYLARFYKEYFLFPEDENTVNLPPKSYDVLLLRCLRARKYDVHRAAKTYKSLCQLHHKEKDIVGYIIPSKYNTLLHSKFVSILKSRDSLGRHILFIQIQNFNASTLSVDEALATLLMYLDHAAETIDTQFNGLVVLLDVKGFNITITRQVTPRRIQAVLNIVQDSYPARFKEFHIFNHHSLFNMLYKIVKPLIKEKIRNRIFFHKDLASVRRGISPSLLPCWLGGSLPDNEYFDEAALSSLLNKDEYFNTLKGIMVLLKPDHNE